MRKSVVLCLLALLYHPLTANTSLAVDSNWISGTNGAWDSSSNWNNNTVPDQSDRAFVFGFGSVANVNAPFPDGGTTVGALRIGTSGTVNVISSLTTSGALDANGNNFDLDPNSTLTGAGTVTVAGPAALGGGNLNVTGGATFQSSITFDNASLLSVAGSATSQGTSTWGTAGSIQITGNWTNQGDFSRVQSGALGDMRLNGSGTFVNASGATFNVSGANPFNVIFTGPTAGTFNNSGTIVVDTATMNLTGVAFNNLAGGSVNLINNGTFNTNLPAITFDAATLSGHGNFNDNAIVQNGGNIAPGNSPGQLNINGNLTVDASTITIELGGLAQGQAGAGGYDFLNVSGAISLLNTPTIAVQLFGGFTPTIGDTFTILAAASGLNGPLNFDFSQAGGAGLWDTSASSGSSIVIRAVPEPSALALLGLSSFGLAFRRRRS